MDTMTIAFEDKKMMAVLRKLINSMNGVTILPKSPAKKKSAKVAKQSNLYRVSPKIKALETGFSLSPDISDDYAQELGEVRAKRYL